jgi:hypothetical protein
VVAAIVQRDAMLQLHHKNRALFATLLYEHTLEQKCWQNLNQCGFKLALAGVRAHIAASA